MAGAQTEDPARGAARPLRAVRGDALCCYFQKSLKRSGASSVGSKSGSKPATSSMLSMPIQRFASSVPRSLGTKNHEARAAKHEESTKSEKPFQQRCLLSGCSHAATKR